MELYKHQREFLSLANNDCEILAFEVGTGKNYTAELWLEQKDRKRNAVIICPKQVRGRWKEKTPYATVLSFEDFLKLGAPENPSAVVLDEADNLCSPLFVPKLRSKRTEKMYYYLKDNPDAHILALTGTPVRSSPWNAHTLLVLTRKMHPGDWKTYRSEYFNLEVKPFLPRPAYLPKPTWRKDMQQIIDLYMHTALMSDVAELPPETHDIVKLPWPKYDRHKEWEPMKQFVADHRLEQESKPKEILSLAKGYRKVVVVAHYTEQIDALAKALVRDRNVFILDGRTKDADKLIRDAESDPECFLIIQASVAAGFELPSFAVMIFASQGYSVRNHVQMVGRIKRINALKPVRYICLLGGRGDKMVFDSIQLGKEFIPSQYMQYGTPEED